MYKVAILYICTGKYQIFWQGFYESFKKNFLLESQVEYFVFTDAKSIAYENNADVHKIYQKNLGWPGNTLRRFDMFLRIKGELLTYDFTYFFNANMRCCKNILEEDFLPLSGGNNLVMVQHAGYYLKDVREFPYEQNPNSHAYVSFDDGKYYVMGSLNGGKSESYLKMAEELSSNIEEDWQNRIVAVWHDESHLNKYLLHRDDVKLLPPSFCADEDLKYPFEPNMVLLNKSKYINVDSIKAGSVCKRLVKYIGKVKRKLKKIVWCKKGV